MLSVRATPARIALRQSSPNVPVHRPIPARGSLHRSAAAPSDKEQGRSVDALAYGAIAMLGLFLSSQASFAAKADTLDALTGETPAREVSSTILQQDLDKVDRAVKKQPTGAVKQAAADLKQQVVEQAEALQSSITNSEAPPVKAAKGIAAQTPTKAKAEAQASQGLQANLAQLKSMLGL